METQKKNAKTPAPSTNGTNRQPSGTTGNKQSDESSPPKLPEQEEDLVTADTDETSETREEENTVSGEADVPSAKEEDAEAPESEEAVLSPILAVSRRFMANLQKVTRGRSREAAADERKAPASRRLRDWDTRLFVLSTLKRLVDNEHFEELEEEDNQVRFTREALHIRNRLKAENDKRQRRRQKTEDLFPKSGLAGKTASESTAPNNREKQRLAKVKKLKEQGRRQSAGEALNAALQKATYVKKAQLSPGMPEETAAQSDEVEKQNSEVKEQNVQKRGFFNFNVKL